MRELRKKMETVRKNATRKAHHRKAILRVLYKAYYRACRPLSRPQHMLRLPYRMRYFWTQVEDTK